MEDRSRGYLFWGLIFLAFAFACALIFISSGGSSPSSPAILKLRDFVDQKLPSFLEGFLKSFPRITLQYVLIPSLLELLFTIPISLFFYREFVRIEENRALNPQPKRFRPLIYCCAAVSLIILIFLIDIILTIRTHTQISGRIRIPATQARITGFMFLVVMNPIMYQLAAGLRISLRFRRFRYRKFRGIMITLLLLSPVGYAVILTSFFCLLEKHTRGYATILKLYDFNPPELSLWISGLIGLVLMWFSIWSSKKFMIANSSSPDLSNCPPEQRRPDLDPSLPL